MPLEIMTDYENRAESLIPQFLKSDSAGNQSNFAKEMRAFAYQVQLIENAALGIYAIRGIEAALDYGIEYGWPADVNPFLDDIGSIVGAPRQTSLNVDYALAIKAQIQINASKGEPERLIMAIQQIVTIPGNTAPKIDYIDMQLASVCLNIENPQVIPWHLKQSMDKVKSAGVSLEIQQSTARPFCFSLDGATPWYSNGKGFGNNSSDINGGQFATPLLRE
jgi:hypothetical protein